MSKIFTEGGVGYRYFMSLFEHPTLVSNHNMGARRNLTGDYRLLLTKTRNLEFIIRTGGMGTLHRQHRHALYKS